MVDFHSHILPGVDDGSRCVDESIRMLRLEAEQGIRHVVATPHFYPLYDAPQRFIDRRNKAAEALRQEMGKYSGLPEITLGAEVYYFRGMSESVYLDQLTIGDSRYILIELPEAPWPNAVFDELLKIRQRRNLIPVIAHIDRYIGPFRTLGIPKRLRELPVLVQANASFFVNPWTTPMALRMLKTENVHLIGSDCHNMDSRLPNMAQTIETIRRRLGENTLEKIHMYERSILGR